MSAGKSKAAPAAESAQADHKQQIDEEHSLYLQYAKTAADCFVPKKYVNPNPGKQDAIVSIDVETTGMRPEVNAMIALGVTVGVGAIWTNEEKGEVTIPEPRIVCKRRWCLPIPSADMPFAFEPRCASEYWLASHGKQKAQLLEFEAESRGKDPVAMMQEFVDEIIKAQKTYRRVFIVGDNPAFDFPFVHRLMHIHLGRVSLLNSAIDQQTYFGVCSLHNAATRHRADLAKKRKEPVWTLSVDEERARALVAKLFPAGHDHYPENDAAVNYYKAFIMMYHDPPYLTLEEREMKKAKESAAAAKAMDVSAD